MGSDKNGIIARKAIRCMNAANFNQDINQPALAIWGDYGLLVDGLGSNAVSNAFLASELSKGVQMKHPEKLVLTTGAAASMTVGAADAFSEAVYAFPADVCSAFFQTGARCLNRNRMRRST